MKFYLGTHCMSHIEKTDVPLFVSFNQLRNRKKPFKSSPSICLDSGAFSHLSKHGKWVISPGEYIQEVQRLQTELNLKFEWIAPQDSMCEPFMLEKTGLSVEEHIQLTVDNFIHLRALTADKTIHIIPVLQGYKIQDYLHCYELYEEKGFDLSKEKTVGLGSVCRRQSTDEIYEIVQLFHSKGLRLHGFGVKTNGLIKYSNLLQSADSMAWSFGARYSKEHCSIHKKSPSTLNCANCLQYALEWRTKILKKVVE